GIGMAPAGNASSPLAAPDSAMTAGKSADPVLPTAPKAAETAPVAEQPSADAAVQPATAPTPVPPTPPAQGDKPSRLTGTEQPAPGGDTPSGAGKPKTRAGLVPARVR